MTCPLFLTFAFREIRFAFKQFRIFMACLFLGTAIIAGVGSLNSNINTALYEDARILIGGDVELRLVQRQLTNEERNYIGVRAIISNMITLRAMAHVKNDSTLVELKAVDRKYPLYGGFTVEGSPGLHQIGGQWGIALSDALARRLSLKTGDDLKIGALNYNVRGIITNEPDGNNQGFRLAPGAIVALKSLRETKLIQPGSLVNYYYRLKLPKTSDVNIFRNELTEAFADAKWQLRDTSNGGGGQIKRFVDNMGQFMTLVGLTALLVGGVGVSNAVHNYLNRKTDTIATFKILGATSGVIFRTYLAQIMIIAALAISLGLVVGGFTPLLISDVLSDQLPVPLREQFFIRPLIKAAFYSSMICLIFTLWPLARAKSVPAARLFRDTVSQEKGARPSLFFAVLIGLLVAVLLTAVLYTSNHRAITGWFVGGVVLSFGILLLTGTAIRAVAARLPRPHNPALRIAMSNIHRPGNATLSIVLSLGLGLILLSAIGLVEYGMLREIDQRVNEDVPSFFFIDIQKDQFNDFKNFVEQSEGTEEFRAVPNLRGRITHVKGTPAAEFSAGQDVRWILRGDRGLTFTDARPEQNELVSGDWWPAGYQGPPELSITQDMANGMALVPGDSLTINVLGRGIKAKVRSIRTVDWGTFGINYVLMFDPHSLKSAPFNYVATLKAGQADEDRLYRAISTKFPAVSTVRLKEVLENVQKLLRKIGGAVDAMAAITIVAGIIVLAGAVATGHQSRIYDSAVLKVLGATRKNILKAYMYEFLILGFATGLVAIMLGTLAAYGVVIGIMKMTWYFTLDIPLITIGGSIAVTLLLGMVSIWTAMSLRPAQVLRDNG